MATERAALLAVPAAAAFLLWPALWNGYPIVFADTGTYLSQAINHYAGWDRPVFYSLFMLPLHATITVAPVVVAQALLTAWLLWLVCRVLTPGFSALAFTGGIAMLAVFSWLPWIVSELMPDLFTPLLILVLCMLACVPERLSGREQLGLAGLAAFMIASQQSSLPLACLLLAMLAFAGWVWPGISIQRRRKPDVEALALPVPTGVRPRSPLRRWLLIALPPVLAVAALCSVNLVAFGRFSISPFGNVFMLARVIYDGPGMTVLRRGCPETKWKLCEFLDSFPPTSDDFLWSMDSPLTRAGGPKLISAEADAIIWDALRSDPLGEARAAAANALEQLTLFASGDGLNAWPAQVSHWIERDFPPRELAAYQSARQQNGTLALPGLLSRIHAIVAVAGVIFCAALLPSALRRRAACSGFLLAVLLAIPLSAAITGSLSAPHDRYQARIMWLPPFIAAVSFAALRRRPA